MVLMKKVTFLANASSNTNLAKYEQLKYQEDKKSCYKTAFSTLLTTIGIYILKEKLQY